jgi:hypothetical protein
MRRFLVALAALAAGAAVLAPAAAGDYVSTARAPGSFPLVADGRAAPLVVSAQDHPGVVRVVGDLQADVERVTGVKPAIAAEPEGAPVIVGTIGKSPLIDRMIEAGTLDLTGIGGRWETSLEQVVEHRLPGVDRALAIAGADQRGTIQPAGGCDRGALRRRPRARRPLQP